MSQTTATVFHRPVEGDCDPYYFKYIDLIPEVDIATYLHTQRDWYGDFIEGLSQDECHYSYAPGKWTLAEMIGHVLDTERIFAYRMLCISRNDKNAFPGFEQDDYVKYSDYNTIQPLDLAAEWKAVRSSTLYLMRHMNAEMAERLGTANKVQVRASAFPYIMAGHVNHHYRMAKEHYLQGD